MKRTERLEQIRQLLLDHPDGLRVIEISEICDVDRRTIYRDLQTMSKMGIPIWQAHGRYGIEREQYIASIPINLNEAFALMWGMRVLRHQLGLENPHALSLVKKVMAELPPQIREALQTIQSSQIRAKPNPQLMEVIENVTHAWADGLKLMIYTRHNNQTIYRIIAPYYLDSTPQGKLFLIGVDEMVREVRIYNLGRIHKAEVLEDEPFHRLRNLDIQPYITAAYETSDEPKHSASMVLRLRATARAKLEERTWFPNQHIVPQVDETLLYIADILDWDEVEAFLRTWSKHILEVLAPAELRRQFPDPSKSRSARINL